MAATEDVTIRDYRPGDARGIVQLLNDVFSEDDPNFDPRTNAQWSWVYEQNPAGHQIIVAESRDGRIVGHYACIPYKVTIAGAERCCGQGVDSMVSKDYRRGLQSEGLFLRTARRYFAQYGVPAHNAFGYGFPNKGAFRLGVRLLNYVPVHAPVVTLGRNLFATTDDSDVRQGADASGEVVEFTGFDERVDRLWERLRGEIAMGTVRDARFLTWRYLACPFGSYRAFGLADGAGELRGLSICRENWTGPPILALAEFLVPAADVAGAVRLLAHVVDHARAVGQQRVELWVPPAHPLFEVATAHGFRAEEGHFNLCIKIYDDGLEPEWVRQHWYFSIGDTDTF